MAGNCQQCTLCCHILAVPNVTTYGTTCQHCTPGKGCNIWDNNNYPTPCHHFQCQWLHSQLNKNNPQYPPALHLPNHHRPDLIHLFIQLPNEPPHQGLTIHIDPNHPNAWKDKTLLEHLRAINQPITIITAGKKTQLRIVENPHGDDARR
jgi:hypothetical protein